MTQMLVNALDSLKIGVKMYLDKSFPTNEKHAILNIFHSLELILKDRLHRIHPVLIYKNIDQPIKPTSYTVSIREIFVRLANAGDPIDKKNQTIIGHLQGKRNEIEHHRYEKADEDYHILAKVLKIIDTLLHQVDTSLEEEVEENIYSIVKRLIYDYDELLVKAREKVENETAIYHKDDLADEKEAIECPECSHETLVVGTSKGNFCFFCDEAFSIYGCDRCSGPIYGEPDPDDGLDICSDCMDYLLSKD